MSILAMNALSRGRNNRVTYVSSIAKRQGNITNSQGYENYYGKNSVQKDTKTLINNGGFSYVNPYNKDSGLLPKITTNQKKEQQRSKNLFSRQKTTKKDQIYSTPLTQSQNKKSVLATRSEIKSNKESDTYLSYLKQLPEEKQTPIRQSKQQLEEIFKPKTLGLVGLNNIGNTCFMNSILQCMLNLPKFNDYFLQKQHIKEMHSNRSVALSYGKLVQLMKSSTSRSETPSEIKNAVASKKNRFTGYGQQDAQQFLLALLELLSTELNRSKNPKYKQLKADLTKSSLQQISEQWWNYYKEREHSVVCDYFAGQILSKVVCSSCGNESIAFDNTWDFSLNFSSSDNGEILRMIENFLKEQTISQDYYCNKCKNFRECKRKLFIYRLPQIIVLQIKRFSYGKYSKQKLNNRIKVPLTLNLSKVITNSQHQSIKNPIYELVGVVNHMGQINYGHYTADCKNEINGKWYNFNDSSVSEISMGEQFQSSSPYLLFYYKK